MQNFQEGMGGSPYNTLNSNLRIYIGTSCFFFILFTITTCVISPIISRIFVSYSKLSKAKKCDWDTRSDSFLPLFGVSITLGYIISDLFIIMINYSLIGEFSMVIHHLMAVIGYTFAAGTGILPFFANFRQLAECSTVFVNLRWFCSTTNEPHSSRKFIFVGWSMVISFFLCRIIVIPYYYYSCYIVWDTPERRLLGVVPQTLWLLTSGTLDVLNVFWMAKMIRGGLKILREAKKKD